MENEEIQDIKDGENEIDEVLEIGITEELIEEDDDVNGEEEEVPVDPLVLKDEDEENRDSDEDEDDEEYDLLADSYEDIDNY